MSIKLDEKWSYSFKEKKITENDWYNIVQDVNDAQNFQMGFWKFISITILVIVLFSASINLIKYLLINPLLPFWNTSTDQTKATIIFGLISSVILTIFTHIIRTVFSKKTTK